MELTPEQLQQIRDIKIHDILNIAMVQDKMSIQCPSLHHNDKSPSFLLDSNNGYYCFGCGIQGFGAIDFVMDVLGCNFQEAVQEIIDMV